MITLISTIVGFLASLLPAVVKIVEKKTDYSHEYKLRELEVAAAKEGIALQTRLEQIKALIEQNRAIYVHDESLVGNDFINNLRASVRPVVTYVFFLLFFIIKTMVLMAGIQQGLPLDQLINLIWDEYTASIFGAIIAFWFGSRLWEKTDLLNTVAMTGTSTSTRNTKPKEKE